MPSTTRSQSWPIAAAIVAGALAIGTTVGLTTARARYHAERQVLRQALLDELQPVVLSNCTLARFGSAYDGGYLMCGNLIEGLETAYSYGVGPNDDWGCHVSSQFQVPVHQYDCFDPARPVCDRGTLVFHDECIAGTRFNDGPRRFDTLANQIAVNGDTGRRTIVKIDVEGAEWDSLLETPDEVLQHIDQMPMELHGVSDPKFIEVIRKLKRTFYIANLHFNNWQCRDDLAPMPSLAYQVLLVNKRLGQVDDRATTRPTPSPLNAPDFPDRPDCQAPSVEP